MQMPSGFASSEATRSSVQSEAEEIVDKKQMKMDWVPYVTYAKRYLFLIILTNLLLA